MVAAIQFISRQWTVPPEEIRRLVGPVAADWTEDQLYAVNQLFTWSAKQALKQHRKRRKAALCLLAQFGLN